MSFYELQSLLLSVLQGLTGRCSPSKAAGSALVIAFLNGKSVSAGLFPVLRTQQKVAKFLPTVLMKRLRALYTINIGLRSTCLCVFFGKDKIQLLRSLQERG